MRIFGGIIFGLIFLITTTAWLALHNADQSFLNPTYVKSAFTNSGIYDNTARIITDIMRNSNQNISEEAQTIVTDVINQVLTPDVIKNNVEILTDQALSDKQEISLDLSAINTQIKDKIIFSGETLSESDQKLLPDKISYNKSSSRIGQLIIKKQLILIFLFITAVASLALMFFALPGAYYSRCKWLGWMFIILAILVAVNYALFHFGGINMFVNLALKQGNMPAVSLDSIKSIINTLLKKFASYYLYEIFIIIFLAVISFVASYLIRRFQIQKIDQGGEVGQKV